MASVITPQAQELIEIMKEYLAIRETLKPSDLRSPSKVNKVKTLIVSHFVNNVFPKLKKWALNHFNIDLSILSYEIPSPKSILMLGIYPDTGEYSTQRITEGVIGYGGRYDLMQVSRNVKDIPKFLQKSYELVSLSAQDLKDFKFKYPIKSTLLIPGAPYYPILDIVYPASHKTKGFTAEELAAMLLHEIGHVIFEFTEFCHIALTSYNVDNMFYLTQNTTDEKIREKIFKEYFVPYVKKLAPYYETKYHVDAKKMLDAVGTIEEIPDSIVTKFRTWVGQLTHIFLLPFNFLYVYATIGLVTLPTALILEFLGKYTVDPFGGKIYYVGTPTSIKYVPMHERNADKFAALHGLGKELIDALSKIKFYTLYEESNMFLKGVTAALGKGTTTDQLFLISYNYSSFLRPIGFLLGILMEFNLFVGCLTGGTITSLLALAPGFSQLEAHGSLFDRLQSVLETAISFLKQENLDPKMYAYLVKNYDQIKKSRPVICRKVSELIKFINKLAHFLDKKIGLDALLTGGFITEMKQLSETINKLIYNKMYYQSAKIKAMT